MASPFARFVPNLAAEWDVEAPRWRTIDGTVVVTDISGFTSLSERLAARGRIGSEELTIVLDRVFSHMIEVASARGGTLVKFGGDALTFVFDTADHPLQATTAALEMRQSLKSASEVPSSVGRISLGMSTGVHSGPIDMFLVGDSHRELLMIGPTISTATRLEGLASKGQIVVGQSASDNLPSDFSGEAIGPGFVLRKRKIHTSRPQLEVLKASTAEDLIPVGLREVLRSGARDAEHRIATVGFVGFSGTDALLAEAGAEVLAQELSDLVETVQEAVETEQITFLGSDIAVDGGKIILVAGVPRARQDDEGRMLRAARQILDSDLGLHIRIGANRGPVFSGAVGSSNRASYTVMGDTVNVAARLMGAASVKSLVAAASVLDRSATIFRATRLDDLHLRGKSGVVEAYETCEETGSRDTEDHLELEFGGRDQELEALAKILDGSGGAVVVVTGPQGIGKSRLVTEALSLDPERTVIEIRAEPSRSDSPYWALRDPVRNLLGIRNGSKQELAHALMKSVSAAAPTILPWLPLLGDIAHIEVTETSETTDLDVRFRPDRTAQTFAGLLGGLIASQPVIVIENADWLDEATATLISKLIETAIGSAFVFTSRARLALDEVDAEIALRPLDETLVRRIANEATKAAPLRPNELDALAERSGGNPLFLGELLRVIREAGWSEQLPDSLEAVASIEIDTLAPLTRQILRTASVLGHSFRSDLLTEVLKGDEIVLDNATQEDLQRFLIPEGTGRMRFRTSVTHDAAYQGLSFAKRKQLHERAGIVIEIMAGHDPDSAADLLARHFSKSGDHRKAWRYSRVAAERAKNAYANSQAATNYETAIEAARSIESADRSELAALWSDLGDVRDISGEYESAREAFRRALGIKGLDPGTTAGLHLKKAESWYGSGNMTQAKRSLTLGRKQLDKLSPPDRAASARFDAYEASVRAEDGDPSGASKVARRAAEVASETGDKSTQARALAVLDWTNFVLGIEEPRQGERAIALYEDIGQLEKTVTLMSNLGAFAYLEGDWDEAVSWYRRSIEAAKRTGHVAEGGSALTMANLAELLVSQRRYAEAVDLIDQSARTFRATKAIQRIPFVRIQEARVAIGTGEIERAIAILTPIVNDQLDELDEEDTVDAVVQLASALTAAGKPEDALERIDLISIEAQPDIDEVSPAIARMRGQALLASGHSEAATQHFALALQQAQAQSDLYEEALTLESMNDSGTRRYEIFASLGILS